jgi:hypothetical protein
VEVFLESGQGELDYAGIDLPDEGANARYAHYEPGIEGKLLD